MSKNDSLLEEQLLDAWLKVSSVIANDRLVTGFSFNEAFVMNLLYRQQCSGQGKTMTATELCRCTHILKSQMNAILNSLETQGMIFRRRSDLDKRQVEIGLNPEYLESFIDCHNKSLALVSGLLDRVGREEGQHAASLLNRMADSFEEILEEKE